MRNRTGKTVVDGNIARRPEAKLEAETVNKLSYPRWSIGPKPDMPWARKPQFRPPSHKMPQDTVTHTSYPAPGYYIDECAAPAEPEPNECPCSAQDRRDNW